jgi:orotidine-5'-phosphate decarboxylase
MVSLSNHVEATLLVASPANPERGRQRKSKRDRKDPGILVPEMSTFLDKLEKACQANRSLLCVGLDPDPSRMPTTDVYEFNRAIVDATADLVCAYKPNLAFYEALGLDGLKALERTLEHIRGVSTNVLIIGDAKRGDIDSVSAAYATALFDRWGFDATTVNAYGGGDSIEPFLSYGDRGVFVWCRSSNPGAADFQDLEDQGGRPLYQQMAQTYQSWNQKSNLGLVAGATYPKELKTLRELCPKMPFLIPGVGAQSGDLRLAVLFGMDAEGRGAIINSSRGVLYASDGPNFAQAARDKAESLKVAINQVLEQEGKGWS